MTSTPWSRVAPIVEAALLHDEQTRDAFVAEACGDDVDLAREVESLLRLASKDQDFLSTPALAMAQSPWSQRQLPTSGKPGETPTDVFRLAPGQEVGHYRIERLLGRGGMGEVYEAEHLEHGRRIALKVLSTQLSEAIDRDQFLREGQLAAAVNHPHVVYIYGSEDIGGMSAIAMELLPGGTLKERVDNQGPLASIEAVDAILQVVSGLDAAYEAGVLHRDIKPSNCFVDADGTVKVGDFGLAIPAEPLPFTTTTTIRATPQFASPEQLGGNKLDVTSEIYAVGATLYYLLTGRPPFDDRDLMALLSRIATAVPPSPCDVLPEIPKPLAGVVLQCLAKSPAHRPASYRVLASMLAPFGSTITTPAPLGMRFAAYVIDTFFAIVLPMNILLATVLLLPRPSSVFGAQSVLAALVAVSYFAITEGVWGASMGKALCGFRVVTVSENSSAPGFPRALFRSLVFVVPAWLASGLVLWMAGLVYSMQGRNAVAGTTVVFVVRTALFVTARRANGFAGIHEWASCTRTVVKSAIKMPGVLPHTVGTIEAPAGPIWVGPYRLVEPSTPQTSGAVGYDDRLRRTVWVRFPGADAAPVAHVRRILRRPTRPRWLAGQRASALAWDAYEHVPGQPFTSLLRRARSWVTVRGWLCDLAEEMQAGLRDGSLPVLELNRVWIKDDGRACLLDWLAPNDRAELAASSPPQQAVNLPQAERFLYRVAVSALKGHVLADPGPHRRALEVRLPISVADCLAKLREQQFSTAGDMVAAVTAAARGPAEIARTKRAVHLSLCAVPTMLTLVIGLLTVYHVSPRLESPHARVGSVKAGEAADRAGIQADDVIIAVDSEPMAFASQLRDSVATHPNQPIALSILRHGQPLMIRATPTRTAGHGQLGITLADETSSSSRGVTWRYLWLQMMAGLMLAGTLGVLSALAGRGGVALRLMNIAFVTNDGALASGSRTRLRALLSWLPVVAASAAAFVGQPPLLTLTPQAAPFLTLGPFGLPIFFPNEPSFLVVRLAIITVAIAVFGLAVIFALVRPERGLQDRLAGTWLVPR
jgi:hypothetical protein